MTILEQAARQRQRVLDGLVDGPRTMAELRAATGIGSRRLAQYLLRMTNEGEITRTRDGKRPDGKPCYLYHAVVRTTITAGEIGARLAANINGGIHKLRVQPVAPVIRPAHKQVIRLFGGLYVPVQQ